MAMFLFLIAGNPPASNLQNEQPYTRPHQSHGPFTSFFALGIRWCLLSCGGLFLSGFAWPQLKTATLPNQLGFESLLLSCSIRPSLTWLLSCLALSLLSQTLNGTMVISYLSHLDVPFQSQSQSLVPD